jgi:hypothetical protein
LAGSEAHEGIVSKHVEASSGGRGQDKNQKKKNRPVEAKGKKRQSRDYMIYICIYV